MPNYFQGLVNSSTRVCYKTNTTFGISEYKIHSSEKSTSKEITDDLISSMNFLLENLSPENSDLSNILVCLKNAKYSCRKFSETIKTVLPVRNTYFNGYLHMWLHLKKEENRIEVYISFPNRSRKSSKGFFKVSSSSKVPPEISNSKTNQKNYLMIQEVVTSLEKTYTDL